MNYAKCPYCREEIEINHDDGYGYDEGLHEQECIHCDKTFVYTTEIIYSHSTYTADCLNGADHEWKYIRGYPKELLAGKHRCQLCGKEEIYDKAAHKKALNIYMNSLKEA